MRIPLGTAIHSELEKLDHQRARIEEILENQLVSVELEDHLRQRLTHIDRRLVELNYAEGIDRPLLTRFPGRTVNARA
jgi:hypothetical protein